MTERGYTLMEQELFITAMEVKEMLGISKSHAYKLVRDLNKELNATGCLTIAGTVSRVYLTERLDFSSYFQGSIKLINNKGKCSGACVAHTVIVYNSLHAHTNTL